MLGPTVCVIRPKSSKGRWTSLMVCIEPYDNIVMVITPNFREDKLNVTHARARIEITCTVIT